HDEAEMIDDAASRRGRRLALSEHDEHAWELDQLERAVLHERAAHDPNPELLLRLNVLDEKVDVSHPDADLVRLDELSEGRRSQTRCYCKYGEVLHRSPSARTTWYPVTMGAGDKRREACTMSVGVSYRVLLVLPWLIAACGGPAPERAPQMSLPGFDAVSRDFIYGSLALSPVSATSAGYHRHNGVPLDELL